MRLLLIICTVVFVVASCAGCSILAQAPSMQHCDKVIYMREGNQIQVQATCSVPLGGALPGL